MTPEQREAIRSNAKYLRNVRPIDPTEIHEYVVGRPHPAAVGQVLREEAVDLGLVEREDGTFVPAPEDPVERGAGTVERFPDRYARRLEDLLVERFGTDWPEGESGDRLRSAIRRLKEDYYRGRDATYDVDAALGYAVYHLPDYYAAVQYVLDDLVDRRLLPRRLRVIDVGAGVGGPALGLYDYLSADAGKGDECAADDDPRTDALVDYHAVEPSGPAADVLATMLEETGPNFHATVHREPAESFDPPDCDLLLFANVLSELDAPVEVARQYVDALDEDGSLVAIAPADRETSTGLRKIERALDDGLTVYSPTVRLWRGYQPADRCWSFDVRPDLETPAFQRRLDDAVGATGEFANVDVQYSYAILRPDGTRRIEFDADSDRLARMADAERHVGDRIDLAAIKLSHDLADDGNPIFLVGDGSQREDHYAVLARETTLNDGLRETDYGDLLFFESALCLWNDDEGAYNLVVDDETVVDAPPIA